MSDEFQFLPHGRTSLRVSSWKFQLRHQQAYLQRWVHSEKGWSHQVEIKNIIKIILFYFHQFHGARLSKHCIVSKGRTVWYFSRWFWGPSWTTISTFTPWSPKTPATPPSTWTTAWPASSWFSPGLWISILDKLYCSFSSQEGLLLHRDVLPPVWAICSGQLDLIPDKPRGEALTYSLEMHSKLEDFKIISQEPADLKNLSWKTCFWSWILKN